VQTRILACAAGGLLGVVATSSITSILGLGSLGMSPTLTIIVCSSIGVAIGYVVSILYDVFASTSPE
jgi:hypothetical protein